MRKYNVQMLRKADEDLEKIYSYILKEFKERSTAENMACELEKAILSLEDFPFRGAERKVGVYANCGYRQLFVKNYTIIYRVEETKTLVIVIRVKYTPSLL